MEQADGTSSPPPDGTDQSPTVKQGDGGVQNTHIATNGSAEQPVHNGGEPTSNGMDQHPPQGLSTTTGHEQNADASAIDTENGSQQHGTANGPAKFENGITDVNGKKLSAAERKKLKKKQREKARKTSRKLEKVEEKEPEQPKPDAQESAVEVEYVSAPREFEDLLAPADDLEPESLGLGAGGGLGFGGTAGLGMHSGFRDPGPDVKSAAYEEMKRVFEAFVPAEELMGGTAAQQDALEAQAGEETHTKLEPMDEDARHGNEGDEDTDEEDDAEKKMSKKKKKLQRRLKIAELKQYAARPDVVEVWDVTAPDPKALVYLKSYRNTVPVPRHWSQKRKYLQGKRGIEKPAFKLPEFIEATGIGEMRAAYHEKEESKKLKQKQRERMQPKMGKLDINYQILHDAFFKYQTKPSLTGMGELYYEGKEFEAQVRHTRPGILSTELQKALGMSMNAPPPWLINMQRYGPPPSYPDLKVPGLNAPIPPGAQFGYHPGGWGKPPVDESGTPLYGDVFGQHQNDADSDDQLPKGELWGDLESEEEESEEEEEESEEEEGEEEGMMEDMGDGLSSIMSGISSMPSGMETPEVIDLRKAKAAASSIGSEQPLYTVLEQKQASIAAHQLLGSDHVYVVPGTDKEGKERRPLGAAAHKRLEMLRKEIPTDVDIAIDPEELETLDDDALRALYEQRVNLEKARNKREDFSDLVAEKAAQQKRKAAQKESGKAKKQKDTFKF